MDRLEALYSSFDDANQESWLPRSLEYAAMAVTFVLCTLLAALSVYVLLVDPDLKIGHLELSLAPVSYAGLGGPGGAAAAPKAFNVTLQARSTFERAFCTGSGGAALQAAFSGLTVAVGHVAPFCVEPRGTTLITGAAASAWTALPDDFRDRINRGVELEVNLSFENEIKGPMWVRCRAMLDANHNTPCTIFSLTSF